MGLEGTLDYLADWMSMARRKKKQLLNTVTLKVRVRSVDIDLKIQKVTVYGFVEAKKVLKKAQSTGKKSEMWPYVPYELMAHPYAAGVYDKKAPANHVRGTDVPGIATLNPVEEKYALMFSDENPNAACSLM